MFIIGLLFFKILIFFGRTVELASRILKEDWGDFL